MAISPVRELPQPINLLSILTTNNKIADFFDITEVMKANVESDAAEKR